MASPFTLPPTGFGPGSQISSDDALTYTAMPSGMRTYSPHIPDAPDPAAAPAALALLAEIAAACDLAAQGHPGSSFDLATLPSAVRALVADALGQGEVAIRIRGVPALAVQESVFAGVWLIAGAGIDRVEVAPIPAVALTRAHLPHRPATGATTPQGAGLANAPAILSELLDKSRTLGPGDLPHVVNLTLLPHMPEDLLYLDTALGEGAVTILSRGYGNCRITAAAVPHVWRVQFFNAMDTLILDTWEVSPMPEVALAATEDLADSAIRIRDVIEAIR
jgi:hydrogenase-1 operon protein HyaF